MESHGLDVAFEEFPEEVREQLQRAFPENLPPLRTVKEGFVIQAMYQKFAEEIFNFPLDEKDVWVVTFPKSGTTWTQEQVWLLANNVDYEGAKKNLNVRFPFIEMATLLHEEAAKMWAEASKNVPQDLKGGFMMMPPAEIAKLPSPRFIKTHLPFFLLPKKLVDTCKVVYVARNPRDVCVSWFHHHNLFDFTKTTESFEAFASFFINDQLTYSPYWDHVKTAWKMRDHPNLLFLFYEDMKSDLIGELRKIAKFLGKEYTQTEYEQLREHLVIDSFKKNPWVNNEDSKQLGLTNQNSDFIRKGKTGNWKDYFSPAINAKFEAWIIENSQDTDLKFKYELESQD